MGTSIDGKAVAAVVRAEVRTRVDKLRQAGIVPGLAAVLVGDDPASRLYVGNKERACREVGIESFGVRLPADVAEGDLLRHVRDLGARSDVHGILVQLPLPAHLDAQRVIETIPPEKDVDGLHPINQGRLVAGLPGMRPCTPLGVIRLLDEARVELRGTRAVVVGRSVLVGKPVALLLLERHATVTVCHSRTANLAEEIARADVLVAAIGRARMIKGEWVRPGAAVIDVGINRDAAGTLCGDVDFQPALSRARCVTPVPGGVGPMTVAMLLSNTVMAAERTVAAA